MKILSILFILCLWATQVFAHGGGLDSTGGHRNRKTGGYHCHRCPCGCSADINKTIDSSTPMRDRPKSGGSTTTTTTSSNTIDNIIFKSKLCTEVIDGDTIIVNGNEKVRLIGVDTPETKHPQKPVEFFGKEASAFTKSLVEGKTVRLTFDQELTDKYGRTLAYIYLEDGTFVNAEIIKQGYGHAYIQYPFKYLEEFIQYEREARINNRGLWKEE